MSRNFQISGKKLVARLEKMSFELVRVRGSHQSLNLRLMKVLLDIEDEKVPFMMEVLKNFKFVKAEPLTPYKAEVFMGLKKGFEEMQQIRAGKSKGIPAKELLNEI